MEKTGIDKIKKHIYSHLSPVYPRKEHTVFGSIISGIAYAINLIKSSIESIRDQTYYSTAKGSEVIGVKAEFDLAGISLRLIDDTWPAINTEIEFNYQYRKVRLKGHKWVLIDKVKNEYNLSDTVDPAFIVYIDPDKLPTADTVAAVTITKRQSVDYLGELAKNRGIIRRSNESDTILRERSRSLGTQVSIPAIRQQLEWLLGADNFEIREFNEDYAAWAIPGLSFISYSSRPEEKQTEHIPELYFGSYACERSNNTFRIEIYIPSSMGEGVDTASIQALCDTITASGVISGVITEITREISL